MQQFSNGTPVSTALYSASVSARLRAAKYLSKAQLSELHEAMSSNCPVDPWPYGCTTVVNPLIVTLGASPGVSPASGDEEFLTRPSQPMPTAGIAPRGTYYEDTRRFWHKIRVLAGSLLFEKARDIDEALALFGNMNLSTGASGQASQAQIEIEFAEWVLSTIAQFLRPRFLILLGLKSKLAADANTVSVFHKTFPDFDLKLPSRTYAFDHYERNRLAFKEWDVAIDQSQTLTIVQWPQHPSRAPFTNLSIWEAACSEFNARHCDEIER